MLANNATNRGSVLAFLQAVMIKSPSIIAALLLLHADKHARAWFHLFLGNNLPPPTNAPQDNTGLTGVLSDVTM